MRLLFTANEFFDVFTAYNGAVRPMQVVLVVLAVIAVGLTYLRKKHASRGVSWILGFLWAWMAVAYHFMYFTAINQAAWVFGALFLAQSVLLIAYGGTASRLRFERPEGWRAATGWLLILYSLVIYPIIGIVTGHSYFDSPTFGVPCPTTIFTFALFCFAQRPFPRPLLVMPILWSAIGGSAAVLLDVPQDFGLLFAGIAGVALWITVKPGGGRAPGPSGR